MWGAPLRPDQVARRNSSGHKSPFHIPIRKIGREGARHEVFVELAQ